MEEKRKSKEEKLKKSLEIMKQKGTGPHIDVNMHNMFKKQLKQYPSSSADFSEFDKWRAFQSQVVLADQAEKDSSLEVIPGIHRLIKRYYETEGIPMEGLNIFMKGPYSHQLYKSRNSDLLDKFVYCRRIPKNWSLKGKFSFPDKDEIEGFKRSDIAKFAKKFQKELEEELGELPKAGDFILWDIRAVHKNGDRNDSKQNRATFYHAYLIGDHKPNLPILKKIVECRKSGIHPADYAKKWQKLESDGYEPYPLNDLGKKLYNYMFVESKKNIEEIEDFEENFKLSQREIDFFQRYGFVVLENIVPRSDAIACKNEIERFFSKKGIPFQNPEKITCGQWSKVASTFGGCVELYWLKSMEKIRQMQNPFEATKQLLANTWASGSLEGFEHPFGKLNPDNLWLYIDRCNYRFPNI
jgi:hypothetical protein